jgi:hypothetical protein
MASASMSAPTVTHLGYSVTAGEAVVTCRAETGPDQCALISRSGRDGAWLRHKRAIATSRWFLSASGLYSAISEMLMVLARYNGGALNPALA